MRDLPSRVVVYLLLAACLFPEVGYSGVWRKLTAGAGRTCLPPHPPTSGLSQARRRVGVAPLRWLFDLLRGPAAILAERCDPVARVCWYARIDGTIDDRARQPRAILTRFTKQRGNHGGSGYPQLRPGSALVACGTRTIIDAVFGPTTVGRDHLRATPATQPARRDAAAGRPQLRRPET